MKHVVATVENRVIVAILTTIGNNLIMFMVNFAIRSVNAVSVQGSGSVTNYPDQNDFSKNGGNST